MTKMIAKRPARKTLRELPSVKPLAPGAGSRVMPRKIKDNITAPTWLAKGAAKEHAFLFPTDRARPTGDVVSVCGRTLSAGELGKGSHGRCKACTRLLPVEPARKGKALTEPTVNVVDTGSVHGDPKEAESRRRGELLALFGDASNDNATTVEILRSGDREQAITHARATDAQAERVAHRAPKAQTPPKGSRDLGMIDGAAIVQGPTMNATDGGLTNWTREVPADQLPNALKGAPMAEANPDALRPTRRNPATGEIEPRAARLDGSLRERADNQVAERVTPDGLRPDTAKRTASSKRRHRARRLAEAKIQERVKGRGDTFVPKGRMVDPVKAEVRRLAGKGAKLPKSGW